jgi:hypothetical protein
MRSSLESGIDFALTLTPFLSQLRTRTGGAASGIFMAIMDRFFEGRDPSRFGLMNAVTSVARDTSDPEVRWRLEEFGGGVPVAVQEPDHWQELAREQVMLRA